ncbi:MAG: hypothetical protein ABFD54_14815 [Armatimonadota bacterium]|nr:hypothetical protein [bacterium]
MNIDKVHSHTAPAVTIEKIAALVVIFGVIYALYLLQTVVGEFKQASAKLDKFDKLSRDVGKLSGKLEILDQANLRIDKMEKYMRYVPMLAKTGQDALAVSKGMDHKLEITNQRLIGANQCMVDSAAQIGTLGRSVDGMHSEMTRMTGTMDKMAGALPSIGGVQQLLAKTSSSLDKTATGVGQVTTGIDKVGGGLDEMRLLLHSMNNQFSTLQEMKPTLDKTNTTLENAFAMLQPLSESIPQLTSSMQEMNQTSRQMSDTTLEMARSIKKTPKQGALGLAILTAVQFAK